MWNCYMYNIIVLMFLKSWVSFRYRVCKMLCIQKPFLFNLLQSIQYFSAGNWCWWMNTRAFDHCDRYVFLLQFNDQLKRNCFAHSFQQVPYYFKTVCLYKHNKEINKKYKKNTTCMLFSLQIRHSYKLFSLLAIKYIQYNCRRKWLYIEKIVKWIKIIFR